MTKWKDNPDIKQALETVLHNDDTRSNYFEGEPAATETTVSHEAAPKKTIQIIKKGQHVPPLGVDPGMYKAINEGEVLPAMQPSTETTTQTKERKTTARKGVDWKQAHLDLVLGMSCRDLAAKHGIETPTIYSRYRRTLAHKYPGKAISGGYLVLNAEDMKLKQAHLRSLEKPNGIQATNGQGDKVTLQKAVTGEAIQPQAPRVRVIKRPEDMTVRELKEHIEERLASLNTYAALLNLTYGLLK